MHPGWIAISRTVSVSNGSQESDEGKSEGGERRKSSRKPNQENAPRDAKRESQPDRERNGKSAAHKGEMARKYTVLTYHDEAGSKAGTKASLESRADDRQPQLPLTERSDVVEATDE